MNKQVEDASEFASHSVHKEVLLHVETAGKFIFPANTSAVNLARLVSSSLNATKPSLSTIESKVAPHLLVALKTLSLSQISYIGSESFIYSYYTEGNQTLVLYSNTTSCYTQQVDSYTGRRYDDERSLNCLSFIDSSWLHKDLLSNSNGYASLGRGWGKDQEQLFISTVAVDGLGSATKDGISLAQTGPHQVKLNNGTVSIVLANSTEDLDTPQTIDVSCEPSDETLRNKNVDIRGTKYMVYCAPLEIAGVPSVSLMVYPHKGLVGVVHRHSKTAVVLLIVLLISLVATIFSFLYLIIRTVGREMYLCASLIKQMESTRQAERKSMNKSLAFASASHDVRSSLAALDGIIALCKAEVFPNSELYMNLEQMKIFTADLLALLNSVLDTSKIEAGKMQLIEQDFNLAQILEESANLYYAVAKDKGIDLVLDPCDGSVLKHSLVNGDRGKLKQVLNNLLHNAIKFTSEGHIAVRAWVQKSSAKDSVLVSKDTGVWKYIPRFLYKNNETCSDLRSLHAAQQRQNSVEFVIEVDDTGKGIPREKQKSVFEDFVQVKGTALEHGGTGLGLGIVQSIVRLMGGDIGIVDKDFAERGTCFRFNIFLSACETASGTSAAEGENTRLLVDRFPMEISQNLELNIRNQSPRAEGSHVVLFTERGERRRMVQRFFETAGAKVSTVDEVENIFHTLERIKHKWHLAHLSSSGKSDLGSDYLSNSASRDTSLGRNDVRINVGEEMDSTSPYHRKRNTKTTLSFVLAIIDFSAAHFSSDQFSELCSILESFKKDIYDIRCSVVWLYTPQTNVEARRREEKKLARCQLIVSKPLHGTRLYQLLKMLPEFGGATTIEGYKPNFTGNIGQPSSDPGPSTGRNYMKSDSGSAPAYSALQELQEIVGSIQRYNNLLAGKKVLVVEDTWILRKIATRTLKEQGATVECCENGEEAVTQVCKALRESDGISSNLPYDYIFMDCQMPIMDGFEATRKIRLEEKVYNVRFPIIALTAHTEAELHKQILLAGMDFVITKPISEETLHTAIQAIDKCNEEI
ncbi:hypothetical protein IFM89_033481 [Coptis chinensis]|uniref:histidine kinase n=1 Tax=Coptis chinensis TaxID=261450 RepID=A0A835HY34_9MAGN|nr:hypothetical protein IFM89_033481 [Coptis chinensis]